MLHSYNFLISNTDMGILGSAIGGALGIGGSIFGGISASKAMKKIKNNLQSQQKENQNWYERRYNEDVTQRADAQRILAMTNENIRQRNRAAAGTQAVTGGTEESVAAVKDANNDALAEAASQIAVSGLRRKDQLEGEYKATDSQLQAQLNNMEAGKAKAVAQAVQGVVQAGAGMSDIL